MKQQKTDLFGIPAIEQVRIDIRLWRSICTPCSICPDGLDMASHEKY